MKKLLWSVILLVPIWATACDMNATPDGYENASIEHVHAHWSQGAESNIPFTFLDVRSPGEYAGGHIPGAKNAFGGTFLKHGNVSTFQDANTIKKIFM